jgi:hypothetical protein
VDVKQQFSISGDGQAIRDLVDWLDLQAGPHMAINHPFEPIIGPGYNLQRRHPTPSERWFAYDLIIDDEKLAALYKLRWL